MLLALLLGSARGNINIGLRVYDGTHIVNVACEPEGAVTSPLRIAKNGVIYGIVLVDPAALEASKIVIQTAAGPKAMADLGKPKSPPPEMVLIPSGEFEMGDHYFGYSPNELPLHTVLVDAFYIGKYEVTVPQYCDFLNSALVQGLIEVRDGWVYATGGSHPYCGAVDWNGSAFTVQPDLKDHPMHGGLSWHGAAAYCNWRSQQDGHQSCYDLSTWECDFTKKGYRLPTEAEWEYAARVGYHDPYYLYPWGNYDLDWPLCLNNNQRGTLPVGSYPAYGYGLHDMAGNAYEWCNDWYDSEYYESSPYDNPTGPTSGTRRVNRGGSWNSTEYECRVSFRRDGGSIVRCQGFRVVLDLDS